MWFLMYQGTRKCFEDWGLSGVTRKIKNQSVDTVTVRVAGNTADAPLLFSANETVQIDRDGSYWFTGIVTKTPVYGSAQEGYQEYTFSGPWWYLDHIIYQQTWKEADFENPEKLNDIRKSRLILGQDNEGNPMTIGAQIAEIIDYVNQAFDLPVMALSSELDLPVYIPFDECHDLSCAEAIKRLLRWVPDVIAFFDYSEAVPVLHFRRRVQLPPVSLDIEELHAFQLTPRYDIQIPAVVLKFEKTHRSNGQSWKTLDVQKYPTSATGREPQALVMTIALEGAESTYIRQEIETEPIQISSATWWKKHLPGLQAVENLRIEEPTREGSLPNELISGSVANWMNCQVHRETVTAKVSYETEDEAVSRRLVAVKINTTDATSKTYRSLVSFTGEETVPDQLAKQVYQGVSVLHYEGQIVLTQPEVGGDFLGKTINLTHGRTEWESMNAVVQSVAELVDSGTMTIMLGPAKHLGPDDLSELTKSNRRRTRSRNFHTRSTGEASGSACVEQGRFGHAENSAYGPGCWQKMTFSDIENVERKIIIDASELEKDVVVRLREEDVSDSGVLKKRYSLASNPFVATES
ncbi:MAG: hypothetical protein K2L24_03740 [Opitutales bacterium]|nr:hypothetical protein [Opitutales bacterium]